MTRIFGFLTGQFVGIPRWAWLVVAGLVVLLFAQGAFRDALEQSVDLGRAEQRADQSDATLKQVEKANAASEKLRRDPDAARDGCLRHARNPADC